MNSTSNIHEENESTPSDTKRTIAVQESRIEAARFADDHYIPNSRLPVLIYRGAVRFPEGIEQQAIYDELQKLVADNRWRLEWLWRVYKKPHYHSTAHETLVGYSGSATVRMGGPRIGKEFTVGKGDVLVIPGGVAHQCVDSTKDFQVFGLYPNEQKWDLLHGRKKDREIALPNLEALQLPESDPLYGAEGPLMREWR